MDLFNFFHKPEPEPERRTPKIGSTLMPAWQASSLFVRFLDSRKVTGWTHTFSAVERAIASGDAAEALRLFDAVPMVNMGSFSDLIICGENGHRTSEPSLDNDIMWVLHLCLQEELQSLRSQFKE